MGACRGPNKCPDTLFYLLCILYACSWVLMFSVLVFSVPVYKHAQAVECRALQEESKVFLLRNSWEFCFKNDSEYSSR